MKTNVYFTVDTEASMGGSWSNPELRPVPASRHVFCRIGDRDFGIPFIVEMMSRYGFRATYFVETLATHVLGDADTASIFDYLLAHNQDAQLHIHPNFRYYAEWTRARAESRSYQRPNPSDLLSHFSQSVQLDLLSEAAELYERFCGRPAAAFRAGCYAASAATLRCLSALGIGLDSSLNPCYPAVSFPRELREPNRVRKIEGVWEIPVTVARTRLPEGYNGLKFADCSAISHTEIRRMLDDAATGGQEHFVIVFHSFSAVKPKDAGYTSLRPNRLVIHRLERLFQYLAENADRFQVTTLGEISSHPEVLEAATHAVVSDLGFLRPGIRKTVQWINAPYWV